jgi:hypothetical protein
MHMALKHAPVNSVATLQTVTGSYLAHAKLTKAQRAFIAADLHSGATQLVHPTVVQSAWLAVVNPTYAHYALRKSERDRALIESGALPLALPAVKALPAPVSSTAKLAEVVAELGVSGTLDALSTLEKSAA